jgi:hypothetical protein
VPTIAIAFGPMLRRDDGESICFSADPHFAGVAIRAKCL